MAAKKHCAHKPVTLIELRAFIGFLLLRGCESDRRCELADLFYGPFSRPLYRATMTQRRCIVRSTALSLVREYYTPSDCITVDETPRAYRGRCDFVIYMPNKPDKYGLLFRDVADTRSRYNLNMLPYAGKAGEPDPELHIPTTSTARWTCVRSCWLRGCMSAPSSPLVGIYQRRQSRRRAASSIPPTSTGRKTSC